jgi:hypothetical protein
MILFFGIYSCHSGLDPESTKAIYWECRFLLSQE